MADKFHSQGAEETYNLLADMIEKHHADLQETEVLILMKHGGWKSKGKPVFGKFKVLGDDLRSTWKKDVILYLNADMWGILSEPQRRYVLDHALYGLDVKVDKDGKQSLLMMIDHCLKPYRRISKLSSRLSSVTEPPLRTLSAWLLLLKRSTLIR